MPPRKQKPKAVKEEKKTERQKCSAAARGGFVVVHVGEEGTKYSVHQALLEKESEFFRAAFSGHWEEATEKVMTLKDVEPRTFSVFVNWLYTGRLPNSDLEWDNPDIDVSLLTGGKTNFHPDADMFTVEALMFGEQYSAPNFLKAVNNHSADESVKSGFTFFYNAVILAFKYLPSHSPILKLMVDAQCAIWDGDELESETVLRNQLPVEFLLRVMDRHTAVREGKANHKLKAEDYYLGTVADEETPE